MRSRKPKEILLIFAATALFAAGFASADSRSVAYPEIPSVQELRITETSPTPLRDYPGPSAGMTDPVLERARELYVFDDFKYLADLRPKDLTAVQLERLRAQGREMVRKAGKSGEEGERAFLKFFIEAVYEPGGRLQKVPGLTKPGWKVKTGDAEIDATFDYTERTWSDLVRKTDPLKGGSLLDSPYPVLIPAGRFQESYYWDSYFGAKGLIATHRLELARMQAENFLSSVRRYGFVPNGGRDYYLSRSQPPVLSSLVRDVYEASMRGAAPDERAHLKDWLARRAYPLIERDYAKFWMNPKTRYDAETGLNHHWDALDTPRPERHGSDNERALGKTYRDVRAAAESGLDFTETFQGEATRIAGVLLNSLLYKTETDLAWMAEELGHGGEAGRYRAAASKRLAAMNRYLWDPVRGRFENYNLRTHRRVNAVSGDLFATLFARVATPAQAKLIRDQLSILEGPGGIRASDVSHSTYQWDGNNGWAPFQFFAIAGLRDYGYAADARRLARKWVEVNAKIYRQSGVLFERVDVQKRSKPEADTTKYSPQPGFLWTNGIFDWALVEILGVQPEPVS
ncbi:MAG: trehalase family glycosidase [Oligoflexia bacterium]|nr:trehalase family glycosidase [Oligoflexia bacterium]